MPIYSILGFFVLYLVVAAITYIAVYPRSYAIRYQKRKKRSWYGSKLEDLAEKDAITVAVALAGWWPITVPFFVSRQLGRLLFKIAVAPVCHIGKIAFISIHHIAARPIERQQLRERCEREEAEVQRQAAEQELESKNTEKRWDSKKVVRDVTRLG